MDNSRSTTTPPNVRCVLSRSDAKTSSSLDQTQEGNGPQPSTHCSAQPSSTALTRRSISSTYWNESPITPSAGSTSCCHGMYRSTPTTYTLSLCTHITLCGYISYDSPIRTAHTTRLLCLQLGEILFQLIPVCVDISVLRIVESERTARIEVDQRGCTARVVFRHRTQLLTSDGMADQHRVSDV